MNVFNRYIERQTLYPAFIEKNPDAALQNIIVIPCYNEPDILDNLNSLTKCSPAQNPVEVIIVINSAEDTNTKIISQNKETKITLDNWIKTNNTDKITFHAILLENIPAKHAGAGFARKIGMDEAIRRFDSISKSSGIITSLDADSLVAKNYLIEIEKLFFKNRTNGCSIYFEHPTQGNDFQNIVYEKVTEYELYMRYYSLSLKYTGSPYYFHTVGSSFAVFAEAYCKQGGMNRKQAGEDFYFLQKIMSLGNYRYLNTTTVFPSPRPSDRVPFGTGPLIKLKIENPKEEFLTYNFDAFQNLHELFKQTDKLFCNKFAPKQFKIHESLIEFLEQTEFAKVIDEINTNTSSINSFRKRLWTWFDAFRILKYLNFAHENYYSKMPLKKMVNKYLQHSKQADLCSDSTIGLLSKLRQIEQKIQ